jgi:P27 family predicted phage terminase small subunit
VAKKPRLTVVGSTTSVDRSSKPPKDLGKAGKALWADIIAENDFDDAAGRAVLGEICRAADRIQEAGEIIAQHGLMVRGRDGVPKENPMLRVEASARGFIVRSLRGLNLDIEPIKAIGSPGRPSGWDGRDDDDED